jgi:hypothetical protein
MASSMFFMPFRPAYDSAGVSVPGAKAYFTLTGTNTPSAPFSDAALTTPRTNPVVADAIGKFPTTYVNAAITYRVRIYSRDATVGVDTPLEEFDPYIPGTLIGTVLSTASTVVGSRSALAGLTGASDSVVMFDGSQWAFDDSDLSTQVTADAARQGIYVAPATAPTGTSGAWVRQFTGAWDARWFGVLFDDEGGAGTDNLGAINAMLALAGVLGTSKPRAGATTERPSITIEFPGYFYVSDTVNLTTQVQLKGFGSGPTGGKFTRWRVPSGKAALVINHFGTLGYAAAYDATKLTSAASSIIEGIFFLGGTEGAVGGGAAYDETAQADGILVRAFGVTIRNCRFEAFKRNGIAIYAGSDANPIYGNANNWMIDSCTFTYNGLHGLHVKGTDANAGYCLMADASFNRRWGIRDDSFLANNYVSGHGANNGLGNGTTDIDSVVAYPAGGQRYAVVDGQESLASTTTPGTNNAVWVAIPGLTTGRTWVSGITVRSGGPYFSSSLSRFSACYSELGQGPSQVNGKIDGGIAATFAIGNAAVFQESNTPLGGYWKSPVNILQTTPDGRAIEIYNGDTSNGDNRIRMFRNSLMTAGTYFVERVEAVDRGYFGHGSSAIFRYTGTNPPVDTFGNAGLSGGNVVPYMIQPYNLNIRAWDSGNDGRRVYYGTGAPTSGNWAVGDFVFNIAPTSVTVLGWRCTAAGAPGTWAAVYGMTAAQQSAWAAWTGTGSKATKAVSTATVADVAAAMKSLIDDLRARGILA